MIPPPMERVPASTPPITPTNPIRQITAIKTLNAVDEKRDIAFKIRSPTTSRTSFSSHLSFFILTGLQLLS